jgi:hypothetical protein
VLLLLLLRRRERVSLEEMEKTSCRKELDS